VGAGGNSTQTGAVGELVCAESVMPSISFIEGTVRASCPTAPA
jgi:hypothetical protein